MAMEEKAPQFNLFIGQLDSFQSNSTMKIIPYGNPKLLPLIKSMGLEHHISQRKRNMTMKLPANKEESSKDDHILPQFGSEMMSSLSLGLLGIISEDVLNMKTTQPAPSPN